MHITLIALAAVDDHLHGTLGYFAERLMHAGQGGHELAGGENVVEPHDGQLLWQRDLMLSCGTIRAYCR